MSNMSVIAVRTVDFSRTRLLYATSLVTFGLLVVAASAPSAQAQTLGPLQDITGRSIFTGCRADTVGKQPGTNYPNTEIEPNLAINPRNPSNMLVGVQQDRWSNGGARGLRGQYTVDAGATWHPSSTGGVTKCQGGPWARASDPWVAFSPNGVAYFSSLVTFELPNPNLFGHNGQTVSRSTDGGATWSAPVTLIDTPFAPLPQPQILNDKNSVTADWHSSRFVYVVWDQLSSFTPGFGVSDDGGAGNDCGHPNCDGAPNSMAIARHYREHPIAAGARAGAAPASFPTYVTGPTWLARTIDGGNSWEKSKIIYDPGSNNQTIANQVVVLRGGIADFFTQQNDLTGADQIGLVMSTDQGATWSPPMFPVDVVNTTAVTPNQQQRIRSADIIFSVAVDRTYNVIYLVWQDTRFTGSNEVAWTFSPDGGYSWATPVHVNQTPRNPTNPLFQQALIPTVTATADSTIVITYYDFRNDKPGATTDLTDYFAVSCNIIKSADACTSTTDWANEVKLTDKSFDLDMAPYASGLFLGDYMGLQANGQTVWPVFGQVVRPQQTDLFTRALTIPVAKQVASR